MPTAGAFRVSPPAGPKKPALPKGTGWAGLSGYAADAVPGATATRPGISTMNPTRAEMRRRWRPRARTCSPPVVAGPRDAVWSAGICAP